PTSMRILVYDFLEKQHNAMSLSEIEGQFFKADRTTIYRTLKTFEEKGIVHGIQENNTTKYILCPDECDEKKHHDWHLHLYCKKCKKTTCQQEFAIPSTKDMKYQIDEVKIFAKGICEQCLRETLQ
ncbi:MAG: Fur family transcriptional regulator, partial [Sphingobacterium sp.]